MSKPNSWAKAEVKNYWGGKITNIQLIHRYDNDHFDSHSWEYLDNGITSSSFDVGFWTGLGRTGKDYWLIKFEADGKIWTCKDNFSCFLTSDDKDKIVSCHIYKEGEKGKMEVICPVSGTCTVSLRPELIHKSGRPLYIIGHRCNDTEDIGLVITKGCNALECDIQYDEDRKEFFVNHDSAAGNTLREWLNNARLVKNLYPNQFSLIIFDCKFARFNNINRSEAFFFLQKQVRDYLNKGRNPVNVIFSMASYDDRECFEKIMNSLKRNEGIAIDQCDEPENVERFFTVNKINNCWYADGILSIGPKDVFPYIKRGCELRDESGQIKKVYVWTLAAEKSIRKYIEDAEVDGVIVNVAGTIFPFSDNGLDDALDVINESNNCRLAVRRDNPFVVFR